MDDFLKKIEDFKLKKGADLSSDEDLSLAVMNLISLEEHFFFSAQKTKNDKYLNLLDEVRELRKTMLAKLMPQNEGETWCISKHLLAATMRFMEVGTKFQTDKKTKQAKEMFSAAYKMYSLFWGVKFGVVDTKTITQKPWDLEDLVTKLVDCCRE